METKPEEQNLGVNPTPEPKNKLTVLGSAAVIVLVLAAGLYFFLAKNNQAPSNSTQNTPTPQIGAIKQFSDTELGVSFSYPQVWGDIQKITTPHIRSTPFDLDHKFNFAANPSVTISVNYLGEPEKFREHADYEKALAEKKNPRASFCTENLEYLAPSDNQNPSQPHSSFRQNSIYSYGACDEKLTSFITARKVSDPSGLVDLDKQGSSKIEISKTYVIESGNQLYSALKIVVNLPNLNSSDYCEVPWGIGGGPSKLKSFHCITYPDKEAIESAIKDFQNSELNKETTQMINSIFVKSIAKQDADNFIANYFKTKSSYSNDKLGIKFDYPSILPTPILGQNEKSITIEGFEIVEVLSRQDAVDIEKSAADCDGMCFGPSITASEWDLHLDILTKKLIDKEKCKDCISITTIGNNKFLMLFQAGAGYSGHPGKRYITYQKGKRCEFNGFQNSFTLGTGFTLAEFDKMSEESGMQKVIKDIIAGVVFY